MQFKHHFPYYLGKTDPLRKIFTDGRLPNGFINKGRCAIGGTTLEINNEKRCSIITVPNISIVKSKKAQHPDIYAVYGDISQEEVYGYLQTKVPGQKIMTTPEGVKKIMWAAEQLDRKEELYREWFFMLDEAHTFITEDYRLEILYPFEHFFEFDNKCIITATPYFFTHPKMSELDYHEVIITEKLGEVTVVNSLSVAATLQELIERANELPGNVHIFFNSVTEIVKAVRKAKLKESECNIFCADDKNNKNMNTLGELKSMYMEQPDETNFKKFNFYTCKYFEGWDMYDKNATLVVVTDHYKAHTKIGIADKAFQAFGRIRGEKGTNKPAEPFKLIHITNHLNIKSMKQHDEIVKDYSYQSNKYINQHNQDAADPKITKQIVDPRLSRFATVDDQTKQASLHPFKLDQVINESSKGEVYNHIDFIVATWEKKYNVELQYSDKVSETNTSIKRKSAAKQFEEDFNALHNIKSDVDGVMSFNLGVDVEASIRKSNPLAYQAYKLMTKEEVKQLKHSPKKIEMEIISRQNDLAEVKLLKMLDLHFKVGRDYTNEYITSTLQDIYNKLNIRTKTGKVRTAEPAHLGHMGRFEIHRAKPKNAKGINVHGYLIKRKQFDLAVAA